MNTINGRLGFMMFAQTYLSYPILLSLKIVHSQLQFERTKT